ncbi:MAG: PspC domain-containing protein [Lachnospiraceae bacterium]
MEKKLYRSNDNKIIAGVCGGIAEFFSLDPTLVRLGLVVFCALGGSGILAYIIAAIIMPKAPDTF